MSEKTVIIYALIALAVTDSGKVVTVALNIDEAERNPKWYWNEFDPSKDNWENLYYGIAYVGPQYLQRFQNVHDLGRLIGKVPPIMHVNFDKAKIVKVTRKIIKTDVVEDWYESEGG